MQPGTPMKNMQELKLYLLQFHGHEFKSLQKMEVVVLCQFFVLEKVLHGR